jgi:type II secretory pathway component HofQ
MRLLLVACVLVAAPAYADRELCVRGAVHRGATIDLDVKDADIVEVYRLLADVGRVNLVLADDVAGKVTLRLKRVPWNQIACTVAAVHKLTITVQGDGVPGARPIYLVRRRVDPQRGG